MNAVNAFIHDLRKYCFITYRTAWPGVFRTAKLIALTPEIHCVAVARLNQAAESLKRRNRVIGAPLLLIARILQYMSHYIHQVEIYPSGEIGAGFYIGHLGNIHIGSSKIGMNCSVTHNVTIGLGLTGAKGVVPTIGNRVWIGTGAVIAGDVTIGDGVTISAGSIVTRDIPAGCLVAGNPARVISRDYDNSHMLAYTVETPPI